MENQEIIKNFKELVQVAERGNPEHIVYKFKKHITSEIPEYIKIKYEDFKEDIKRLSTAFLNLGLENQKIVLVGSNRYEWCVSYLAITTGNMIVVPLDRALPDNELEKLIKRSEATAVIFENKHKELVEKIVKEENQVKIAINMDKGELAERIKEGKELLEKGDTKYDEIEIDSNKMSIMLFTSGTTDAPKAVMLSQNNI